MRAFSSSRCQAAHSSFIASEIVRAIGSMPGMNRSSSFERSSWRHSRTSWLMRVSAGIALVW